jgi:hypothetical protein
MANIFWPEIKTILAPGLGCMKNITVSTDEGVFEVDLGDLETVRRLHAVIAAAINAWERDGTGQWKGNPPQRTKDHPMPPRGPLPVENVDKFLAWVADGMPEGPLVA